MNKAIIVSVVIIAGSGIIRSWQKHAAITPVILGSYIFLLVLALLDVFGGPVSRLAGMMAVLAATYVMLTEFPWSEILSAVRGK